MNAFCQNVPANLENSKLNFSFPSNPSVYEFSKYGNVPVNEYRGLAQVSIPLYNINVDGVEIPVGLSYFSGGIKVAEEASIVGLGWNMSFPTIIQSIKDEDDIESFTKFQTLPGFTGNPLFPTIGGLNSQYWSSVVFTGTFADPCTYGASVGYNNDPGYFVSTGNAWIDRTGKYQCNSGDYQMLIGNVDTEPDTFSVNINGDNLIIIRDDIGINTPNPINNVVLPLKVINGHSEYKVYLTSEGIKIVDYKGIQYFFGKVDKVLYTMVNNGFLYTGNSGASASNGVGSKIHKLTKIITPKNEEIIFSYSNNLVVDLVKESFIYYKNMNTVHQVNPYNISLPYIENFEGIDKSTFTLNQGSLFSVSSNSQTQNYSFLNTIFTPNEQILFSYSSRDDYQGMKKLDNIAVKNIKNEVVKNISFDYDFFTNGIGYLNKRLKLISLTLDSQRPYLFDYNSTSLPSKNSFSIDYWGFYNGKPNTSLLPNLSHLGYSSYSDNSQNDFKSYISFCKAATLEKIYYPTGGYSEFEYELHSFDDLILHPNMNNYTPLITTGGGLRIKSIKDYSANDAQPKQTNYEYFNGKVIFKKRLARSINDVRTLQFFASTNENFGDLFDYYKTSLVEANLNNGNLGNIFLDDIDDYIGYDKVVIKEIGSIDNGRLEKEFENNPYSIISPVQKLNFRPSFYRNRNYIPNGTLKNEMIYDGLNQLKVEKKYAYNILTSNIQRYGVNISSYDTAFSTFFALNLRTNYFQPRFLLTSYPIFANSTILQSEKTTEYFPSGSKWTLTNYTYDSNNVPTGKTIKDHLGNTFYQEGSTMAVNTYFTANNILSLPSAKATSENGSTKSSQNFFYNTNSTNLNKVEELPEGNPDPTKKVNTFFDLYDDKNNLIQFHRENGVYTSIVWGYNKSLPLAKIENATIASITPSLITAIQTASNTGTEASLLTELTNLRNALPNAMITTYTHRPLIGVSTITDSKGDKLTYNYDTSGRLINVKDKDGNIVSENEYHFKL